MTAAVLKDSYRPYIDGLRAIAIAVVVLYHAKIPGFSGGFVGVDVFFVISGFLISKHLLDEAVSSGSISLLKFYARRIRRLLPALSILVIFVLLVWSLLFSGLYQESKEFYKSVKYSVLGAANFFFMNNSGGYFDLSSDEMPLLHFWSLAVEEQFYLLWPLAIFAITKMAKKFTDEKKNKLKISRSIFLFLCALAIVSFAANLFWVYSDRSAMGFYLMPARGWEFAIGGFLALSEEGFQAWLNRNSSRARYRLAVGLSVLGIVLIGLSVTLFSDKILFPGFYALMPTLGTAALLLSCLCSAHFLKTFLSLRPVIEVGILSYGIYLWHWPLLALLKLWSLGELPTVEMRILAVAVSVGFAYLSLNFVERPFWKSTFSRKPAKAIVIWGVSISVGMHLFSSVVREWKPPWNQVSAKMLALIEERNSFDPDCVSQPERIGTDLCVKYGKNETKETKAEIFAWGDSHAFGLFPMLESYIADRSLAAVLYSNGSKPPFLAVPGFFMDSDSNTKTLQDLNVKIIEDMKHRIARNPNIKFSVVVTAYWQYCRRQDNIGIKMASYCLDSLSTPSGSLEVLQRSLGATLDKLAEIGVYRILVVLPFPKFRYPIGKCLQLHGTDRCSTSRVDIDSHIRDFVRVIESAAAHRADVRLIRPVDYFCTHESCPQIIFDGEQAIPVVFDDNHPSASASRYLGSRIRGDLDWLVGDGDSIGKNK